MHILRIVFLHKMMSFLAFLLINLHLHMLFTASNLVWLQARTVASVLGNETDHLALFNFKESISSDPLQILASWNSSKHFCNWLGVSCGHKHQRVTGLNLQGYDLHGSISPHLGNLSFLRYLNLQNNSFHGEIPQELTRLFRLQHLLLANNTLAGEIPTNLTSCFELRSMRLHKNNLLGKIPMEIGSLRKLERLTLAMNHLMGQIPISIGNLSSLIVLSVAYNNLEGNIPEEIGHLKSLKFVAVVVNNLSGTFPLSLYNLSSLTLISAASNQFNGSLPANMFLNLPNLQDFAIAFNQMSGPIPSSITNASMLRFFDIPANNFVGPIPRLGNLQHLQWLGLSTNNLSSNSSNDWEFLTSLTNCSELKFLDFSSNGFKGHLPNYIGNLSTQLSKLSLGDNQMYGNIPVALGNLINLISLEMDNNHFTGIIPITFGKFEKMQLLNLTGNKLSGQISIFIGNLSYLIALCLSQNMIQGNIPPSVGNCQRLQYLDLSQNNLSGTIPSQTFGLSSLSILLNLSQNSLSGKLPVEVGKLKNIGKLDISNNHLFGVIPGTIGECKSLEYLNLKGNSFHGIIPSTLSSLKGLRHLDLSRNNLSGSIPTDLQNISFLEYLNVSFNMLDGEVPREGVFQNASMLSVTGNAKLCGGIFELHLPLCPIKVMEQRQQHSVKFMVVIICVVVFILLLSSILVMYWMKKRKELSSNSLKNDLLPRLSYQSLHNATDGFSTSNLIGSGNFGSVYKARLDFEEEVVAIKVLNLQKKGAHKSFMAETNALRNIRHRNLVKIITCCSSIDYHGNEFKALVYEYMENGSLEKLLHLESKSGDHQRSLDLLQRLNIIIDVASALHYLHHSCTQPIVHCDLKPSNVLLDANMVAHVSDFGLARLLSTINGAFHKESNTIGVKGTIGYAPPEYGMGSQVSTQGDVYSFGILMLEMLTGRRPTDETFKDGHNLHNYVKSVFPNNFMQIVDPTLLPRELEQMTSTTEENISSEIVPHLHPNTKECLCSLLRIGLSCSLELSKERINMIDVLMELNLIRNDFLPDRRQLGTSTPRTLATPSKGTERPA